MRVKSDKVSEALLRKLAKEAEVEIAAYRVEGAWHCFVLRPTSKRWETIGHSGKRVHAVCWHGHRAFMDLLFQTCHDAQLRSTVASYNGSADYKFKVHDGFGKFKTGFESTHRCHCGGF